jgi:hypothetical protein
MIGLTAMSGNCDFLRRALGFPNREIQLDTKLKTCDGWMGKDYLQTGQEPVSGQTGELRGTRLVLLPAPLIGGSPVHAARHV